MSKNREVRELQFSSTQLIILFLAILVLGIFIFLLGVSVGKKQTRLTQEANLVRNPTYQPVKRSLPVAPKEEPGPTAIDKEIASHTQQSTASKTGAQPQQTGSLTPAAKTATPTLPLGKPVVTDAKTAPSKTAATSQVQPQTKTQSAVPAKTKTGTTTTATKTPAVTTRTTATPSTTAKPKTAPAKSASAKAPQIIKGYYYIQLAAFDERAAAVDFSGQIRAAGYPTLVMDPTPRDKKPWYRVRVGGYATKEEAERTVQRLRTVITGRKFEYWITRGD